MLLSYLPYLSTLPLLALAAPSYSYLPPCNPHDRPCKCPHGSTFKNLTSFGIIGAPALEVQKIMANFLEVQWQGGLVPASTTGKGDVVGATRTFNFTGPDGPAAGYYQVTEILTKSDIKPDGSFEQAFSLAPDPPSVQIPHGGTYYGEWILLTAQQTLIANETAVAWKNWRCETGLTFPAAASHEGGIANVSAILQKEGKHTGVDVKPFTIFYEVRND